MKKLQKLFLWLRGKLKKRFLSLKWENIKTDKNGNIIYIRYDEPFIVKPGETKWVM